MVQIFPLRRGKDEARVGNSQVGKVKKGKEGLKRKKEGCGKSEGVLE